MPFAFASFEVNGEQTALERSCSYPIVVDGNPFGFDRLRDGVSCDARPCTEHGHGNGRRKSEDAWAEPPNGTFIAPARAWADDQAGVAASCITEHLHQSVV